MNGEGNHIPTSRDAVTPQIVAELMGYVPETGELTWKRRARKWFVSDRAVAIWNGKLADRPAFTSVDRHGYKMGRIFRFPFSAHRVAWAISFGEWPDIIDHVNGVPGDNRLGNLRSVSRLENQRNMKIPKNNTSGVIGVGWNRATNRWAAKISVNNTTINLGHFSNKRDAVTARKAAEAEFSFHQNHGRAK